MQGLFKTRGAQGEVVRRAARLEIGCGCEGSSRVCTKVRRVARSHVGDR